MNFRESLEKGFATIECLAKPNVQAEYSSISELELMAGRAKGKAVVNAAREGVPDRMWGRLYDKEVGARLTTVDLTDIKARVEELSPTLERAGIPAAVSDQGRTRDVLDLAKGIAGLVYLASADSVIFASALIARADFIITADEYFRKTINRIRSGQQPYDNIRRQVRTRNLSTTLRHWR